MAATHNNRRPTTDRRNLMHPRPDRPHGGTSGPVEPAAHERLPGHRRHSSSGAHTSLETAAQAFRMLTTGPDPLSLDGAVIGCGLPRRMIPLRELRAILLHPAAGRRTRDAAWRQIVENAHSGSAAWVVGAVGVALPALRKMAADLGEGYRGDVADLHAAILTGFVAALHRVETSRPGIITRLRWAAYRAGLLVRYERQGLVAVSLPRAESAPPPYPWAHPDLVLADAVAKGVLSPLQAELIGRSRLEAMTLKQAAAELGVGYQAARKARQRGEARLVAAIASGDVEKRLSPPAPKSGLSSTRTPQPTPTPRPSPVSMPSVKAAREPAGVRGNSTPSDGTPDQGEPDKKGVFCGPAHQPPSPPTSSPSPSSSSTAASRAAASRRRRRRRHRPHRTGGTP
jgi:hypothetical protein